MKKRSPVFLIILSLILLLSSCGIPNYFGNIEKYTNFSSDSFSIEDTFLPDGFSTTQIEPKIMFLYTIYSDNSVPNTSYKTIETKLKDKFIDDFKLADYDYKGCPNTIGKTVSEAVIKDSNNNEVEYNIGLYQLKVNKAITQPSSYNSIPTNYSNEYLFNKDNLEFKYGTTYSLSYELKAVGKSDEVVLVISCLDSNNKVVASYEMVNFETDNFHTSVHEMHSADYQYAKKVNPQLCILPVLYLESNVYNNRQMKTGSWITLPLESPKPQLPESNDNTLPNTDNE